MFSLLTGASSDQRTIIRCKRAMVNAGVEKRRGNRLVVHSRNRYARRLDVSDELVEIGNAPDAVLF